MSLNYYDIVPVDKDQQTEFMWRWPIIQNATSYEELEDLFNQVHQFCKESVEFSQLNAKEKAVIRLFQVALFTKLHIDDWHNPKEAWRKVYNQSRRFSSSSADDLWEGIATAAEKHLSHTEPQKIEEAHPYEARIKIQAGIPLQAIDGNHKVFEYFIFQIWQRLKKENETDILDWIDNKYWPGGKSAGLYFADAVKDLLIDLQYEAKEDYEDFFRDRCFSNPSLEFIKELRNEYSREDYTYVPWRTLLTAKRFLDIDASSIFISVKHIESIPSRWLSAKSRKVRISLKGSDETDCISVKYSSQGLFTETIINSIFVEDNGNNCINFWNPIQSISAECFYGGDKSEKNGEFIGAMPTSDIWLFKKNKDNRGEWISNDVRIKRRYFPIYVVATENQASDYKLPDPIKTIEANEFFEQRFVYEIDSIEEFINAGFQVRQIKHTPPSQTMSVWIKGSRIPHINLGSPTSTDGLLYYRLDQAVWNCNPSENLAEDQFYHYRFSTSDNDHAIGENFVVLPKAFKYSFSKNDDESININFGDGVSYEKIWTEDSRGHLKEFSETDNFIASHEDVVCINFKLCNEASPLTIRIPSPLPGVSWRRLEFENAQDAYKTISTIPIQDIEKCQLYFKSNYDKLEYVNIEWTFELLDEDKTLAITKFTQKFSEGDLSTLIARIPNQGAYKLFTATNIADAKIVITAKATDSLGNVIETAGLTVTRFDNNQDAGHYFYVGLLKGNVQNNVPSGNNDIWLKVPAFAGTQEWNGRNALERINDEISESSLKQLHPNQTILMNGAQTGSRDIIKENIQKYYDKYFKEQHGAISYEDLQFLRNYFNLVAKHHIPQSNLWLFQEILNDDRLFCKLPEVNKISSNHGKKKQGINDYLGLTSNKSLVYSNALNNIAFDWRLVRLSSVEKYVVEDYKDAIREKIERAFKIDEDDLNINEQQDLEISEPEFYTISQIDGKPRKHDFASLEEEYSIHFTLPWNELPTWEKAVCFILDKVILTEDDECYKRYHNEALCYLRQLEIFRKRDVSQRLCRLRNKILGERKKNYTRGLKKGWDDRTLQLKGYTRYSTFPYDLVNINFEGKISYQSYNEEEAEIIGRLFATWYYHINAALEGNRRFYPLFKDFVLGIKPQSSILRDLRSNTETSEKINRILPQKAKEEIQRLLGDLESSCIEGFKYGWENEAKTSSLEYKWDYNESYTFKHMYEWLRNLGKNETISNRRLSIIERMYNVGRCTFAFYSSLYDSIKHNPHSNIFENIENWVRTNDISSSVISRVVEDFDEAQAISKISEYACREVKRTIDAYLMEQNQQEEKKEQKRLYNINYRNGFQNGWEQEYAACTYSCKKSFDEQYFVQSPRNEGSQGAAQSMGIAAGRLHFHWHLNLHKQLKEKDTRNDFSELADSWIAEMKPDGKILEEINSSILASQSTKKLDNCIQTFMFPYAGERINREMKNFTTFKNRITYKTGFEEGWNKELENNPCAAIDFLWSDILQPNDYIDDDLKHNVSQDPMELGSFRGKSFYLWYAALFESVEKLDPQSEYNFPDNWVRQQPIFRRYQASELEKGAIARDAENAVKGFISEEKRIAEEKTMKAQFGETTEIAFKKGVEEACGKESNSQVKQLAIENYSAVPVCIGNCNIKQAYELGIFRGELLCELFTSLYSYLEIYDPDKQYIPDHEKWMKAIPGSLSKEFNLLNQKNYKDGISKKVKELIDQKFKSHFPDIYKLGFSRGWSSEYRKDKFAVMSEFDPSVNLPTEKSTDDISCYHKGHLMGRCYCIWRSVALSKLHELDPNQETILSHTDWIKGREHIEIRSVEELYTSFVKEAETFVENRIYSLKNKDTLSRWAFHLDLPLIPVIKDKTDESTLIIELLKCNHNHLLFKKPMPEDAAWVETLRNASLVLAQDPSISPSEQRIWRERAKYWGATDA